MIIKVTSNQKLFSNFCKHNLRDFGLNLLFLFIGVMATNLNIWRESASLILAAKMAFSYNNSFNYKILFLKRSSKSQFMPDTYVFPGGKVSKSDSNVGWLKLFENFGVDKQSFNDLRPVENIPAMLQNDNENEMPKYLSLRICAIRETFEECGILLCKSPKINSNTDSKWASFIGGHEFISWQHKVNDNSEEFLNLCKHFEIYPDVWALKNWSHWITPPVHITQRFKTVFFLTTLHQMPAVHGDEREIQDLMWSTPDYCIEMNKLESVMLPPPQFYELSRLKTITDIEKLSIFAAERSKFGFEAYWPYRVATDDGIYTILPGDDLYPGTIDKEKTDIPFIEKLPDCQIKNRIFHKTAYGNDLIVENFRPKDNHIVPVGSVSSKM